VVDVIDKDSVFKICIVKLSAMGDIIHAMIALQFIKKHFSNVQIDWVVENGFEGVLENNVYIDNILAVNLKSIKKNKKEIFTQIKLLKKYALNNYDIVIDAQGLLKSAIVSKIIGGRIVNSKIIGFDKDSIREGVASWFYDDKISIPYENNVIERNLEVLCSSLGLMVDSMDILKKDVILGFKEKDIDEKFTNKILFVIGASKINKIYPQEKYLELAQQLKENIIVVWGNEDEYKTAQWLSAQSNFITTAPKGNLNDLKSLISKSKLVIGSDTGPTHMAWALNIPSITIFGNTPEYRNTYITEVNKVIKSNSKVNPLKIDKEDFSIKSIKVRDILVLTKGLF
jgi:heptosyltransferase-1